MSKLEDKTLNSLRLLSEKRASKNQGSISTLGGVYVAKNIKCDEEIITGGLIVDGVTKLTGDVSIGGTIYCPNLYSIGDDTFNFKRNLVPESQDDISLGTRHKPWNMIYAKCIKSENIESSLQCSGTNTYGNTSFEILSDQININNNLNIINPETNIIMIKSCNGAFEIFVPIYKQWNSFQIIQLIYNPNEILHITTSHILLHIENLTELCLIYDGDLIPDSTKVKIYFINKNHSSKANYKLTLTRFNKKYIFTSIRPVNKIKFITMKDSVYLIC